MRRYLQDKQALLEFARQRPQTEIQVRVRNGHHPFIRADYVSQATKGYHNKPNDPVIHQICVKSKHPHTTTFTGKKIDDILKQLTNKSGRKNTSLGTATVKTQTPSIQGVWTPSLNLHLLPKFDMKIITK
jgi:S-adenosylmethionine synthetase